MNIVIVGAGNIGLHLASLLSKKNYNVIVIEKDEKKLEHAAKTLDIGARLGSGTDWRLLDELAGMSFTTLLAVTDNDETNLNISLLAKHLNYSLTIARIGQNQFINCERLDIARIFQADYLIAPELLVATDIYKLIAHPGPAAVYNFSHGAVQMRAITIPPTWKNTKTPLSNLKLPSSVKLGLIKRENTIIFPHGNDYILPGDEITFIGERESIQKIHGFFDIFQKKVKSVIIAGGSQVGFNLAKILEKDDIYTKIIEKDFSRCEYLSDRLPKSTILHADATDPLFLSEEKVGNTDIFVACTRNDATNLLISKLAKDLGTKEVITCLANQLYTPIDITVPLHKSTEKKILAILNSSKITSIVSLYEDQAEIIEIKIGPSLMTGIPISDLSYYLPKDFLFVAIQNQGRIVIANGSHILTPGDTIITITHPQHLQMLRDMF